MATTCLSGTLPGRVSYGANQASGHLEHKLSAVRNCVIAEQLAKARGDTCSLRPYISPRSADLPSHLLATHCPSAQQSDVSKAIAEARGYTVAVPGGTGSAIPSSVYMKRKMDMLNDPRLQSLQEQKQNNYNKVYPPRVIDTCPPPQVIVHAGEPIPVPFFKCALLNILVSN
jgi:hypothetical protein